MQKIQNILEQLFRKLTYYVIPLFVLAILLLSYYKQIPVLESQKVFANRWINLLLIVLFIKPLVIIPPKYSKINLFTVSECVKYFITEWTKKPILQYLFEWIKNLIFSVSFYLMKFRRELWILVFRFIFLHFALLEISRYSRWLTFTSNISEPFIIIWILWLLFLFVWFITSNSFSLRLFKTKRKPIQKVAYFALIWGIVHIFLLNPSENWTYILILIIYFTLKCFERKKKKIPVSLQIEKPITKMDTMIETPVQKAPEIILIPSKIIKKQSLNPTIIEFTLEIRQKLKIIPWQWVLVSLQDDQWVFFRAYSVAEHEIEDDKSIITLIIKIKETGRASNVFKNISIWEKIPIKWVFWNFILDPNDRPKVFIATGTWLAPIYNMVSNDNSADRLLLFSVSYKQDLFYEDKVKKIKNLTYKYYISRENIDGYEFGRIDLAKFDFKPETEFYICGSPEMVKSQKEFLVSKGFSKIYVEQY